MIDNKIPARVRFAPSPTGHLHIGGARTALYNYLLAKKTGGEFILRFEDTDQKRKIDGAEDEIINGLKWLGIDWDEGPDIGGPYGPYRQSEKKEIYQGYADELIQKGHAYYCFCTSERLQELRMYQQKNKISPHYDGKCRDISLDEAKSRVRAGEPHVIRFKTPKEGTTSAVDLLRGEINVENSNIDDYILVKSDGWALYHLAAMVDDHLMKINYVFRGSEWLPTFPLHSMLYKAFRWEEPTWVHLSVFLKPSGKGKMSKREGSELLKDGRSIFVKDLQDLGYLPEAVTNWITLMGWSYDDHTEYFDLPDLINKFDLKKLNPAPAAINFSKLDHFNGLHIRNMPDNALAEVLMPYLINDGYLIDKDMLLKILPLIKERIITLDDAPEIAGYLIKDEEVKPNPEDLIGKKMTAAESKAVLEKTLNVIKGLSSVELDTTEPLMRELVEEIGLKAGQVFGILRVAVTGKKVSPPLFESIEIIGKDRTIERIKKSITLLEKFTEVK